MPPRTVLALLGADRRRLGRDGLLAWVAALPLVMAVAVRAGLLWLAGALEGHGIMIGPWLPQLRAVALAVVVPVLVGVVVGFMLLEEKQDRVWVALAVTEVSLWRYLAWRAATCLTAAALVTFACLRIAGPAGLGVGRTAWAAVGAAPLAGAVALGLAAWARDTIQGFAAVKLLLVVLVLPAAAPALAAPWCPAGGSCGPWRPRAARAAEAARAAPPTAATGPCSCSARSSSTCWSWAPPSQASDAAPRARSAPERPRQRGGEAVLVRLRPAGRARRRLSPGSRRRRRCRRRP